MSYRVVHHHSHLNELARFAELVMHTIDENGGGIDMPNWLGKLYEDAESIRDGARQRATRSTDSVTIHGPAAPIEDHHAS